MTATEAMERATGRDSSEATKASSASRSGSADPNKAAARDQRQSASGAAGSDDARKKKRRKVNHACLYCRRSHMTCDLRNIGHLCHDEPRDNESKKSKSLAPSTVQETASQPDKNSGGNAMRPPSFDAATAAVGNSSGQAAAARSAFEAAALAARSSTNPLQLMQPTAVSGMAAAANALGGLSQFPGFSDAWMAAQNPFHEMHTFHSNFVIAPEVTNEFNLLNDFLQTSLLDDGALLGDDRQNQAGSASGFPNSSTSGGGGGGASGGAMPPPGAGTNHNAEHGKAISRPSSVMPTDKTREYYLQAADPSGNATPEERMRQVLQAKYEAGLLKPFNYVKGYTRLQNYLEGHVAPASKQKILRQLDRFRPKFREKMKDLTDVDLVLVEMWFERTLLDYDRVFASMAVPACCWRRTGEIFRGNKEMAELIKVPVEDLRGGKIALHEILTEESNVRYWEEFGTIAFDSAHDTLLTACSLKSPRDGVNHVINCCFSFRIRRDEHKVPSLIVGNFLPHDPDPDQ
ncbi:hypothetical protein VTJ49DRAFT_4710 [Mycothermus thermophilus]|uniref:ERT1/acuK family PAS domain-containing protein n=1 Tax=Humicola insolens TaxID=85995 RepID=A0ABR3V4V4_HUMIN